jgi:hypothetical protein
MANVAFLRSNLVVCIAPTLADTPAGLVYDSTRDAAGANIGDTWNGSAYVRPPVPVEQANEFTLRQQAEAALVANRADISANDGGIANNDAWLAANPGTNLTTTVLTTRMKVLVQQSTAAARQRNAMYRELNGIIRLFLNRLDGTD